MENLKEEFKVRLNHKACDLWDRKEAFLKLEECSELLTEAFGGIVNCNVNDYSLIILNNYQFMIDNGRYTESVLRNIEYSKTRAQFFSDYIKNIADYYFGEERCLIKLHPGDGNCVINDVLGKYYDDSFSIAPNIPFQILASYYRKKHIRFKNIIGMASTSNEVLGDDLSDKTVILGYAYMRTWFFYDSMYISLLICKLNDNNVYTDGDISSQIKFLIEANNLSKINLLTIDLKSKNSISDTSVSIVNCLGIKEDSIRELENVVNNVGKNTNILFLNLNHTNLYFNNNLTNRILAINLHKDVTGFERTGYFHDEVIYAYCGTYDFYQKVRTFTHERVMKHQGYTLRVSVSDAMFELNNRALLLAKPKEIKVPVPSPTPAKKPESKQVTSSQPKDNLRELLHNFITARIDISLSGITAKLEILNISDKNISHTRPNCINENGNGHILESSAFKLDFEIKAVTSGDLSIHFRGVDVREGVDNTIRVPYWIDYKSIKVDGKELLKQTIPTWYEQILPLNGKVNAGDTIKLHVEWEPHRDTRRNIAI